MRGEDPRCPRSLPPRSLPPRSLLPSGSVRGGGGGGEVHGNGTAGSPQRAAHSTEPLTAARRYDPVPAAWCLATEVVGLRGRGRGSSDRVDSPRCKHVCSLRGSYRSSFSPPVVVGPLRSRHHHPQRPSSPRVLLRNPVARGPRMEKDCLTRRRRRTAPPAVGCRGQERPPAARRESSATIPSRPTAVQPTNPVSAVRDRRCARTSTRPCAAATARRTRTAVKPTRRARA